MAIPGDALSSVLNVLVRREGQGFNSRREHKIIFLFLTLALQSFIKIQTKIQEKFRNDENRANQKKSLSTHRELNPGPSNLVDVL